MNDEAIKSVEHENSVKQEEREWDEETIDITKQVASVNEFLKKHEPNDVSIDTYSGYSGYAPQWIVDGMNAYFGFDGWGFNEIHVEVTKELVITKLQVWIRGIERRATAYGQSRITKGDLGDAMKGAQTDALKKGLSYFSIGNRAYRGELPTEKKPYNKPAKPNTQNPQNTQNTITPKNEICQDCFEMGGIDTGITSAEAEYSRKMFGRPLCRQHQQEQKETVTY